MASGASHADVAIMLVDARHGVKRQTRRHAAILDIVGVKRVILAVNKMDLVDWSQERFRAIEADFRELTLRFGFREAIAIPVSAVGGDNVARSSEHMPWYTGPHLLEHLERIPPRDITPRGPFRLPVQTVLRDGLDFRGLAGTVASGCICVGDRVTDALSGQSAHVLRIATMGRDLEIAKQGQAVALQLDTDIDVARGAVLSLADHPPTVATQIEARIVWLWETPFDPRAGYFLRTATDLAPISTISIKSLLDLETLDCGAFGEGQRQRYRHCRHHARPPGCRRYVCGQSADGCVPHRRRAYRRHRRRRRDRRCHGRKWRRVPRPSG